MATDNEIVERAKSAFIEGVEKVEAGRYVEAELCFRRSLECLPERVSTLGNLCAVLIFLGKREEAQGVNAKILQLDPANEQAQIRKAALLRESSGEFESAIALLKDLLHASQDKASVHFQLGLSYRDTANLVEAERHFKLAAQLNPANWENWFQLANTQNSLAGNGPQPEAISSYRKAGEVALLQPVSSQRYGAALINAKEFELARQFLITSLDRYPENIELHANLGLTYFSLSQNSAAIDAYKRVLNIDEGRKDARCNLVLAFMADARYAEAISCLEHSAKEDLDQYELMLLARCQFNQGDFESTLRILQNYEVTQPLTV